MKHDLNKKAMHELVLYFLRERLTHKNIDIRHLVITNIYEWFIFDGAVFERLFTKGNNLVKQYNEWNEGQKITSNTDLFYKDIIKPFIASIEDEIAFTWFDIREFEKPLKNDIKSDDNKLISLFKIFSPTHLLNLSYTNDSNTLDKGFYSELLHLIGLEEEKEGSKKLIRRKKESKRDPGSLLENTITILEVEDTLHKVRDINSYGETKDDRLFSIALELCITWINRILFLKLLEAQLIKYHKGDRSFKFLNYTKIPQYDELYKLFFQVLAKKENERIAAVKTKFANIPYLNSSLFEISELEDQTIRINSLDDTLELNLIAGTVLKDKKNKPIAVKLNSLQYLFEFLEAYDFASEGSEEIQEESKTLINASVLGLIFEKINGYKDGSFFTPGFITMYMCRQAIRQAVLQKFKEEYKWDCSSIEELAKNYVADKRSAKDILQFNETINSLKICDPAVGSGHFLVSSLNEIIAIKSELAILADDKGLRLSGYEVTIENDELIVTAEDEDIFEYQLTNSTINKEAQRVQETLFHEKQTIIENCLFGVDVNPNSVKICRLRLWIELLKNAYYTKLSNYTELETLPNIDINIKCGNSLISRFVLDENLNDVFKQSKYNVETYKLVVKTYKDSKSKDEKAELQKFVQELKEQFKTIIYRKDPIRNKLQNLRGDLLLLTTTNVDLFGKKRSDKDVELESRKLQISIAQKEKELEEKEKGRIFNNAFEWRFEFPEVLDDAGKFTGFDIVIGNPPYIAIQDLIKTDPASATFYKVNFESTHQGNFDIYIPFIELADRITSQDCKVIYILPSKFLTTDYGEQIRNYLLRKKLISNIIDFEHHQVFDSATTYTCIILLDKNNNNKLKYRRVEPSKVLEQGLSENIVPYSDLVNRTWVLDDLSTRIELKKRLENTISLINLPCDISRGSSTGDDKVFVLKRESDFYINGYGEKTDIEDTYLIKPIYATDFTRYAFKKNNNMWLIYPYTTENYQLIEEKIIAGTSPKLFKYLLANKTRLEKRKQLNKWYGYSAARNLKLHGLSDILIPLLADKGLFTITPNDDTYTLMAGGGFSISIRNKSIDRYYLLAILNSKFMFFLLYRESNKFRGGYITCTKQFFENLPIKVIEPKKQQVFIELASSILQSKKDNLKANTSALEKQIDDLVYNLYNLTPEEIQIIETSVK